ncbi:MAG: hypothetical protein BWK72_11265 [Rhodoferax ferrireducens]|uniref:Uncharacterized protein n=1 Tax=Rhodoferax ferrireducens TaxID=192843 RepID=A0A1W9KUV8_9BURK|nr:MAG: hypothetical protein BWK72_11265 [Rhodoferax ferrireducens]
MTLLWVRLYWPPVLAASTATAIVHDPLAAIVPPVTLNEVAPANTAGEKVGLTAPDPEQVAVAVGVAATLIVDGKTSVNPMPVIATGLGLVMVMVNAVAAPPRVSVELPKFLAMVGLANALTLMLWLTAPELDTAPPSLPVTAKLLMA